MRIEGPRIAKITAKHSPAVQAIEQSHAWVSWMLPGACRSPSLSIKLFGPEDTTGPSVRQRKKKLRGALGLMQAMERGFRGVF
jgi:hypothetical protein